MSRAYGLHFPLIIEDGQVLEPGLVQSIDASLRNILSWDYGKRFFNPAFGSRLNYMLGEGLTSNNLRALEKDIETAITEWEPRLSSLRVSTEVIGQSIVLNISANITNLDLPYQFNTGL